MELNKILTGMALSVVIIFGFVFFISAGVDKYHPSTIPEGYNASFGRVTSEMSGLYSIANETKSKTNIEGGNSSNIISDFLGFFFGQGYRAAKVFLGGLDLMNVFVDEFISNTLGASPMGMILKSTLYLLIIILFIAIVLHFIIKSDRL